MSKGTLLFAGLLLFITAGAASATTITFTGSESDFTSQGVSPLQDDGIDTEFLCGGGGFQGESNHPLDIGRVYLANDATHLYLGMQYDRVCLCEMNLGWAFDVAPGGSTSDPLGRQIDWINAPSPPDVIVYDVIPTTCDNSNREVLFQADGAGGWATVTDGPNALGIVDPDGGSFVELRIPIELVQLNLTSCDPIRVEFWTTREGTTKPAFDMVANDAEQRSTPSGTQFDVPPAQPSLPSTYLVYMPECPTPAQAGSWGRVKTMYR
ncbi:MAG TPA: hypothetical protein VEY91_00250 [Candidatus Limnocylindria bacterium]|nr:hypothetical protein [Candidatus Limnocylindria bacterium]